MANNPTAYTGKKYRAVFTYNSGMYPGDIEIPKQFSAKGYGIEITKWLNVPVERSLIVEFRILSGATLDTSAYKQADTMNVAPIAIGASALILAALGVLGVSMLYLTLSKVEEIVDSPVGGTLSIGVLAIAAFILWQFFKRQ